MPSLTPLPSAPLVHLSSDFIRAKEYLEAIVASTSDAICTTDIDGRLIYFSPGAERMLGIPAAEVMGRPAHELYSGGREEAKRMMRLLKRQGALANHEMVLNARGGRRVHISMSASLLRDRGGRIIGTLGISKDITSRVELENRLRELTITDNLTGLYNQRHFHDRLETEVSRARRQRQKLSMVLIDLDGFKQANDLWGHLEGDRILKAIAAAILKSIRREVDSAYRYGGDEFVILLPGLAAEKAAKVMRRVVAAAMQKISREGVGFSFGIATLGPSQSLSDLIRCADRRMFEMKSAKKKSSGSHSVSVSVARNGAASSVARRLSGPASIKASHRV